jgi:hypothetical protein
MLAVTWLIAACGEDDTAPAAQGTDAAPDATPGADAADARDPVDATDVSSHDDALDMRDMTASDAPSFVPADPLLLSTSSPGRDEDPFVLRARDGFIYVVWFSERTGNGDIYLRRTRDGVAWSDFVRVSSTPDRDLYPSLHEDDAGRLHAAWFRRGDGGNGRGYIVYTSTSDGLVWNPASEVAATAPVGSENDWTPSIVRADSGALVIAFARDDCYPLPQPCFTLKVTTSADGAVWSAPLPMVVAAGEQDHLPFLARDGANLLAVWNRYAANATLPYVTDTTDVFAATSADGVTWTVPAALTANDAQRVVDVFPILFSDHDRTQRVAWLAAPPSSQSVVERAFTGMDAPVPIAALPTSGYSHHVVATPTPDVYLGAWVMGAEPSQEIYVRVFRH